MNKTFILLTFIILAASCRKSTVDIKIEEPVFSHQDWTRIQIPDGGEALAVAGNIDDTLLVTTLYNTYIVSEKGTKFTLTTKHLNTTPGLLMSKDTIFALQGRSYDAKSERIHASMSSYYTLDKGLNWAIDEYQPSGRSVLIGVVKNKENVTYELDYNTTPGILNGDSVNFVKRTTISKVENGVRSTFEHPVEKHQPLNLYLDEQDRLYILTGGSFNDSDGYIGPSVSSPAYIYISKKPVS